MSENYYPRQQRAASPHLRAQTPSRRQQPGRQPRQPRRSSRESRLVAVLALLVIAAIVGGGIWMWLNRTVRVIVNGTGVDVSASATLEQIMEDEGISPKAGNLVSVGGNLLEEGGGTAFTATVDGETLDEGAAASFRASGNESIIIGDGTDVVEASHEEEREVQPQLEPADSVGAITFVSQYGKVGRQKFTVGDVSGETVAGEVIEPVQNVKLESINPRPEGNRKVVAITFDDGPSSYTQRYLDILSEHGARATFFCLGSQIPGREDLVQAIKAQGSQVCSHTQNHEQLTAIDTDTLRSEIGDAFSAISSAGGGDTTTLRPPYGSLDAQTWVNSGGNFSASVIWNLDSLDWELPGVDTIVSNCTEGIWSGAIILMHDGGGNRDQDLEALPKILEKLQSQGYEFVTLSELFALDSRIPAEVASGNARMPEDCVWATSLAE
ncbi:polysaccharide deacetylase family protein [Olsenella sp. An293]|uniref:polysaccharide deacetylase family protein n=1 Tax=Olsenella sp. An293 TaxID=1965626 RepID=UPI000B393628|nr:polysaccharide deacetylase family protein [Olsenella sp. An293]OUO32877.1 hypothetical protein B5F85_04470 [Olsenella sp. An293]